MMTKAAQYEKEGVFVPLIDNFSKIGSSCMSFIIQVGLIVVQGN